MTFQQIEYSSGIFEEFNETPEFVKYVQQKHQAFLTSIVSDVGSSALSTEMDSDVIELLDEILAFGIWFKCHIKKQKYWFKKRSVPNQWLDPDREIVENLESIERNLEDLNSLYSISER